MLSPQQLGGELHIQIYGKFLPFHTEPTYPGITLDRAFASRQHMKSLRKKLTSCVALLRWLAGSGWGANANTLCVTTLAMVHSTTEFCTPVWCHSAHTCLIDSTTNNFAYCPWMPSSNRNRQLTCLGWHPTCWTLLPRSMDTYDL